MNVQFDMFPPMKLRQISEIKEVELEKEKCHYENAVNLLNKNRMVKPNKLIWGSVGGVFGFFVWFFRCFSALRCWYCDLVVDGEDVFLWDFSWISFFLYILVGCGLSVLLCILIDVKIISKNKIIENKCDKEFDNYTKNKQVIENKYKKMYDDYKANYDRNMKELSIKFSKSNQVKSVAESMIPYFEAAITNADRSSYIEHIIVPLWFRVYCNQIEFSAVNESRITDFDVNRFNRLNEKTEQEALARAIASTVQVELLQIFLKDPSGTIPEVQISYSYDAIFIVTEIKFIAPNGNYKMKQSW